jgi:hypothetical protein
VKGQILSSKVADAHTKEAIPYATIQLNKKGVITNEEGRFSFIMDEQTKATDTLFITCLGYEKLGKPLSYYKDSIIYLVPKAIELKSVIVSNQNLTAEEIIEKVRENIDTNYNFTLTKKRLFYRESEHQFFNKTDFEIKKSTISEFNKEFLDSVLQSVPKSSDYYSEVLCDLYGDLSKEKQKIKIIKASKLYDKNNEVGLTALEDRFNDIIKKNVKPDSYFKVKSGWFGGKVSMHDFLSEEEVIDTTDAELLKTKLEDQKKKEADKKLDFAKYRRSSLTNIMQYLFFQEDTKLNFITKPNKYDYSLLDFTYLGDEAVYVLEFSPAGGADYKGKLYINSDNFAIIRADYENVKNIRNFRLLGISFQVFMSKGKSIFAKDSSGRYSLQYFESESGANFGIERPIKIVEKNKNVKGRRKQNELYLELDMGTRSINKKEVVIFEIDPITTSQFDALTEENNILPIYMAAYNPDFWKDFTIIEPNQAIKDFTVIE